ncbi:MAG: hypothetical protein LBU32_27500 [Clostridiales bacterium]|jgi:hypothetical protein|nr:hypothetical protein [Clostridiales bacterium]
MCISGSADQVKGIYERHEGECALGSRNDCDVPTGREYRPERFLPSLKGMPRTPREDVAQQLPIEAKDAQERLMRV